MGRARLEIVDGPLALGTLNGRALQISSEEGNESGALQPIDGKPGYFKLGFKNANYIMTPEETTTGAVRLEDKKAGVVWVQIPSKSMLLNSKIGQRMVDSCQAAAQRT